LRPAETREHQRVVGHGCFDESVTARRSCRGKGDGILMIHSHPFILSSLRAHTVRPGVGCHGCRRRQPRRTSVAAPDPLGELAVPGENLTRIEAQERRSLIDTESYEISLDLTKGAEVFGSRSVVRFSAKPGSFTFIDLIAQEVREISLNGEQLDPSEVFADSRIALADLQAENVLVVDADCLYTNTGEGLHRFVDPVDGEVYLYSQFEVPDSRRMFAVFEQPDL